MLSLLYFYQVLEIKQNNSEEQSDRQTMEIEETKTGLNVSSDKNLPNEKDDLGITNQYLMSSVY